MTECPMMDDSDKITKNLVSSKSVPMFIVTSMTSTNIDYL